MTDGRFISYLRVSTARQGTSGLGLEAQRNAVAQFLNGGNWSITAEYVEVESGRRADRPELAKAIARARRERATLVIAKIDRLARNVAFVSNLMESGVEFVAADMPSANRLTIHILAAVAEEEARAISKRTKDALAAAKARGVVLGMPGNLTPEAQRRGASLGGEATKRQARESYSHIADEIKKLAGEGMSLRAIAEILNVQMNERTRTGALFTASTVHRILARL